MYWNVRDLKYNEINKKFEIEAIGDPKFRM